MESNRQVVFPGDTVARMNNNSSCRLGSGLGHFQKAVRSEAAVDNVGASESKPDTFETTVVAYQAGLATNNPLKTSGKTNYNNGTNSHNNVTNKTASSTFILRASSKRYIPCCGDHVIGQVVMKTSEMYWLDIGWANLAQLGALAFGSMTTRKSRPTLEVGDIVYARVANFIPDSECELECSDKSSGKQGDFGAINGGSLITNLNIDFVQWLFFNKVPALELLGKFITFELCIGINGRVWVNARSTKHILAVRMVVENCYGMDLKSQKNLVAEARALALE